MRIFLLIAIPVITIGVVLYGGSKSEQVVQMPTQVNSAPSTPGSSTPAPVVEQTSNVEESQEIAPQIVVPDNFMMETKVFFQQRDGSIYDSLTKIVQYFDTIGNRYRSNLIDSSNKVVESEVSLFNEQQKLKLTTDKECERYFHPTQI